MTFAAVLAAVNVTAFAFIRRIYQGELQPAIDTPEAQSAYAEALHRVILALVAFDVPLLAVVAAASYLLARASLRPLIEARRREADFAADAAHELRTPLTTIASVAQAAQSDASGPAKQALATIAKTSLEAADLVNDLLTLTRSSRPHALLREPVDLGGVLALAAPDFSERAGLRGIELLVRPASAIVNGDERRLLELVRNLLDNATRHARSRVLARVWADERWALVSVEDDGDGVDEADRERVFERFFKVSETKGGSGLGLAICRWVARAHGGDVRMETRTRFVARLPRLAHPGNHPRAGRV